MKKIIMHGNVHLPRNIPVAFTKETNEYGVVFATHWFPATDSNAIILVDPDSCTCDACRGINYDVYDQQYWNPAPQEKRQS